MVKKSSFLEKLKNRLRHSDVRVESPKNPAEARGAGGAAATATAAGRPRVEPVPAVRDREVVSGRKMSQREEATVAIQDGFRELTSLLRGMQHRVEDQGERFTQAADGIARLPALQEAQLDMLRKLAAQFEKQNRTHELVASSLGDLPHLMGSVREALDRAAATDERTAGTLQEFRTNMERIQGSMDQMVDHSRRHADTAGKLVDSRSGEVKELAETLSEQQKDVTREAVARLEATQRDSVRSLRDAQADQSTRIGKWLEDGKKTSRAVLVLLGLTFLALVTIAVLLATR